MSLYTDSIPPAQEYTLNYDVRFHKDFEFVLGGKLPGFYPDTFSEGCSSINPKGWSARLMWRTDGALEQYIYHQDRKQGCGDRYPATGFKFQRDRWYKLATHVKVNSAKNVADGSVVLYVDGQERVRTEGLRLRGVDEGSLISKVRVITFHGGKGPEWTPSKTVYAYFDNFTVYPGLYVDNP